MKLINFLFSFTLIATVAQAQWSTATLSQARSGLSAASVGTKVFFAGGSSNVVDIYDNSTNTWSTATLSQARYNLGVTSVGTKVFFAGGNNSNVVDIYDNSTNTWSTATLSQERNGISTASVGTKVFFAGGSDSNGNPFNVVDIYDNNSNTWSTATLSQARYNLGVTSVGTKVIFAGGSPNASAGARSNVVDVYDNSTNTWSTATLSQAKTGVRAASVGTKAFFAGGLSTSGYSDLVDIFDNSTNTWSTATLSQARSNLGATSVGTKVFFAGGYSSSGPSNVIDVYDNSTNIWLTITLSQARYWLGAASVGTKVFFGGGQSSSGASNVVDIYNAAPIITSFNPTSGGSGIEVTLTGVFDPTAVNNRVYFNGAEATVTGSSFTNLTATVPAGASTGPISVTLSGFTSISSTDFTVICDGQTITFNTLASKTYGDAPFNLTATASSGLPVSYTSSAPSVATVADPDADNVWTVTIVGGGTTDITASQPGDATYCAAPVVTRTLTVNKASQTITFSSLPVKTYGDAPFNLTATASSGLLVSYASSNTNVATVTDTDGDNIWTVTIVGAGSCDITASQGGNANYQAAADVIQTLTVNKTNQTITFGPLPNKNLEDPPFALNATSSSGLAVSYTSSDPGVATVSGNTVTLVGPGTTTITASQIGDTNYNPATDVPQNLVVGPLSTPAVSATFIEFTAVTDTGMTIGFVPGDGNRHLVVIKPSSPDNFFTPADNTAYAAGYTSNGSTVVMSGSGLSTAVTGLTPGTKYYVKVFEFNEVGSYTSYLTGCVANAAQQTTGSGGSGGRVASANSETAATTEDDKQKGFDLKIIENPFGRRLAFIIETLQKEDATVLLTDMTGRTILESKVTTNSVAEIERPVSQGTYLLKVKTATGQKVVRVVKVD